MRLKHLVVASLLAGALAVAGATTLAQPSKQPQVCLDCYDTYNSAVEDCEFQPGRTRTKCISDAADDALECLADALCGPRRGRR